jgi:two-component system phosphate regulon sensor histidine kinase PhoR
MLGAMDGLFLITTIGLTLALLAALFVIRRQAAALDRSPAPPDPAQAPAAAQPPPAAEAPAAALAAAPASVPLPSGLDPLLPVGVLRIDGEHRITEANDRARELLAVRGPLRDRSLMEAFLDARVEAALDAIPVGGTATLEHRAGGPDGAILVVRGQRVAPDDLVVVLEDVSELRRLQRIRTEFIDNLGHELRTPLSTVTLLAETLAREAEAAEVPPRMRERIARLEVETGHIAQMVNEMLDLARIEGGSQLRLDDEVDLARLAEASTERLRLFADRNGVTLVTESEPDLPP